MNRDLINLTLTSYQVDYLKGLAEQDYDNKKYAYWGLVKRFIHDKVMIEALIAHFDRAKNIKRLAPIAVIDLLNRHNGSIFYVEFEPRLNPGTLRKMACRLGVKGKKTGKDPYDFAAKGLLSVFDMSKQEHRCIPFEGVKKLTINKISYEIAIDK